LGHRRENVKVERIYQIIIPEGKVMAKITLMDTLGESK
jgi:hypothetical protein